MKFLAAVALICFFGTSAQALEYTGVNLSGAEFGGIGGAYGVDYSYPTLAEVDYFLSKGMNTIRLPFLWERLQPTPLTAFNTAEMTRLTDFVDAATAKGANVIIDPHNYGAYYGWALDANSSTYFNYLWSGLAQSFGSNDHVIFGLMNEPHGGTTENWLTFAQSALSAIRATGAENLILVPGNGYTGAYSWVDNAWYGSSNASVMGGISNPLDNFAFEVHEYMDWDHSGRSTNIDRDPVQDLAGFTNWLRETGNRGFLGEFSVGAGATQKTAVQSLLGNLADNADVWAGWTWWGAGPRWGDYMFSIEPRSDGTDAPQMAYIQPFVAVPEPASLALVALAILLFAISKSRTRLSAPLEISRPEKGTRGQP